ncbi:MAG: hypothetical protein ABIT20_06445 [Gemmatimonadaceae bacterium]
MTAVAIAATPSRARTGWALPALVMLAATIVVQWASVPYMVGVLHDDGIYLLLARSIASGHGFHYSHLVGAPAATHYPPLYPLFLAGALRFAPTFPANVSFLLGLNAVLIGVASYGWWWFATTRLAWSRVPAAIGALIATLSSPTLMLASALLSEPLFLALLFPAVVWSERSAEAPDRTRVVATAAFVGAIMLVRTHALALLLAYMIVLVARKRWLDAALSFGAALVVQLPWMLWSRGASPRVPAPLEGAYGPYLDWFFDGMRDGGPGFVFATARVNVGESWLLLQDRVAAGLPVAVHHVVVALVLAALVAGAWSFARRAPVTIIFSTLYLGIVMVWPYAPWRFAWAVWPLIVLVAMEGVRSAWLRAGRWRVAVAIAAALPALAFLRVELHAYATRSWRVPARQASAQIAPVLAWVRAHTAEHDVVLSEGEQMIALYTGRKAAPPIDFTAREYLYPPDVAEGTKRLSSMLGAVPARFVILLAPSMAASADALAGRHPGLRRIEPLSTGAVYEVVP